MEDGSQALELTSLELSSIDSLPGFEFRTQTSKLLLECSSVENLPPAVATALGDAAVAVLGSLLCENDEVVETFFLLGCAFARLEEGGEAMNYLNRAKEMLEKVKKGIEEVRKRGAAERLLFEISTTIQAYLTNPFLRNLTR